MNITSSLRFSKKNGKSTQKIASDLACIQEPIVNVYFVGRKGAADRSWVLVDTGLPMLANRIRDAAERRFGAQSRPAAIILTHGHFDHVGGLPYLADLWDVPVYAHQLELPYLMGRSSYPPPDSSVGGGVMSLFAPLYPRGPVSLNDHVRPLPADGSVPGMPAWRWLHTPGHAPGHISLFREEDRVLIVGDAFVTTRQESLISALTQPQRVCRPPAYFTYDWETARRSVELLALLRPRLAATGHGAPMKGDAMRRELERLVDNWDTEARPRIGRYVDRPAVTGRQGVVSLPPAVIDATMLLGASIGVGLVAGALRQKFIP